MISLTINGKEVFSTKDIIFFFTAGFMMGLLISGGFYTNNIPFALLLITPILIMFIIYILKLVKTLKENVKTKDRYTSSKKSNEDLLPPPIKVTEPSEKFFEA